MSFFVQKVFTNITSGGAGVTSADYYPSNKNMGDGFKIGFFQIVLDDDPGDVNKDVNIKVEGLLESGGTIYSRLHTTNLSSGGAGGVHGESNYYTSLGGEFIRLVQFVLVPVIRVRQTGVASSTNTMNVWLMF